MIRVFAIDPGWRGTRPARQASLTPGCYSRLWGNPDGGIVGVVVIQLGLRFERGGHGGNAPRTTVCHLSAMNVITSKATAAGGESDEPWTRIIPSARNGSVAISRRACRIRDVRKWNSLPHLR